MRRIFSIGLIAIFSLASLALSDSPAASIQVEPPLTIQGYWELVRNTQRAIIQMEALTDGEIRQKLDETASQWEKITAVELSDNSLLPVNPTYLVNELKKDPPDLERVAALLEVLWKAHAAFPQKVFTVQDVEPLTVILARPEFQWADASSATPDWVQKFWDALMALMDRLAFGVQNAVTIGRIPLIMIGVGLFIFTLYSISRNLSRNLVREAELAAEHGDGDALLTSQGALQRAQTLSSQGDYRTAVRYLYLSSLLTLDEQGLLRYDRSRTNREYVRSISARPQLANPLRNVIDVFDRVWYGFEAVDDETYQSYVRQVEELQEKKG